MRCDDMTLTRGSYAQRAYSVPLEDGPEESLGIFGRLCTFKVFPAVASCGAEGGKAFASALVSVCGADAVGTFGSSSLSSSATGGDGKGFLGMKWRSNNSGAGDENLG
jgi:hypothetical protein